MTPSGVEHPTWRARTSGPATVIETMTPSGVEHAYDDAPIAAGEDTPGGHLVGRRRGCVTGRRTPIELADSPPRPSPLERIPDRRAHDPLLGRVLGFPATNGSSRTIRARCCRPRRGADLLP